MFPRIMRTHLLILSLAVFSTLAGCGTKTPLSLPPGAAKPPVLGVPAPVTPSDNNNKAATVIPQ